MDELKISLPNWLDLQQVDKEIHLFQKENLGFYRGRYYNRKLLAIFHSVDELQEFLGVRFCNDAK